MKAGDVELARLAQARGWISTAALEKALSEADRFQALGLEKSVEEILVESGALSNEQARALREDLGLSLRQPRIGDYEVIRRIGVGGMGTVFEACHVRLRQRIALKILLPRLSRDPQSTERFLREARMLARLNHPHLVHAIDAGQDGERYYLAMEYIEGENLLQMLLRAGPLDPVKSCEVVRDVCEALEVLEGKALVHRDVKPANILVGDDGVVKLADFGLLLGGERAGNSIQQACGTPHYVSPEQVERKVELDVRSDLYSLAASWYHLVTGKPPFTGKSTREIIEGHLRRVPLPPSRLRPELPLSLDNLLLRWLSKNRENRPASATQALREVEILLSELRGRERSARLGHFPLLAVAALSILGLCVLLVSQPWRGRPGSPATPQAVAHAPGPLPGTDVPQEPPAVVSTPAAPVALEPAKNIPDTKPATKPSDPEPRLAGTRPTIPLPVLPLPSSRLKPFLLPLADAALAAARRGRVRLNEIVQETTAKLQPPASGSEELKTFRRAFHASLVALEPRPLPGGVILAYELVDPAELMDFRANPGSWSLRDRRLVALSEPLCDPLWSVACFEEPVTVEGELSEPAPLIIGFEDLCVAMGDGVDARVWREDENAPVPILAAPVVPGGAWRVTFEGRKVELVVRGRAFHVALPLEPSKAIEPGAGRILVKLAPSRSIRRLRIDGRLAPGWVRERLRLLGLER